MEKRSIRSASAVETIRHKDRRKNIPTSELRDFIASEELNPKNILYARDISLDPQLIWTGKDEQDSHGLQVPVVPIYVQEKIHPQAIIDSLVKSPNEELNLYADFNGGPSDFDKKVEFYRHEQNWTNRMILGDSLLVMNSLAEKEGLKGKVQMIYFDPPYGIKFNSNWQVSTRKKDIKDGKIEDITRQPEQVLAFRDTWSLGIHSYLAYLRDRLKVARDLLTDTGSIFIQISDENVHLVRNLMDEVFGKENFIAQIWFQTKKMSFGAKYIESMGDYILYYALNKDITKYRQLFIEKDTDTDPHYSYIELPDGTRRTMTKNEKENFNRLPSGSKVFIPLDLRPAGYNPSGDFNFEFNGNKYHPGKGKSWKTNKNGMNNLMIANRLYESKHLKIPRWN